MKFRAGHGLMVLGVIMFTGFLIMALTLDYGTKEVDCYDEFRNEMIDQKCIEENNWEDAMFLISGGFLGGAVLIVFGSVINGIEKLAD